MSLLALPAELLHTVMHSLQAHEIIALARCSQWTWRCADSEFAWRHCPPTEVQVYTDTQLPRFLAGCNLSDPTVRLRFRTLSVEWKGQSPTAAPSIVRDLIRVAALFSVVALHVQTFDHCGLISELLSAPALQLSLHTFTVRDPSDKIIQLAAQLPFLSTLGIQNRISAGSCNYLSSSYSLTSLSLWFPLDITATFGETLGSLEGLRELSLREPNVSDDFSDADGWPSFCASLSQIESLDIHDWVKLSWIPQEQLTAGFSELRSLQRLKLALCGDVDPYFIALHAVPTLRTLVIDTHALTVSVLSSLLDANSLLHAHFPFLPDTSLQPLLDAFPHRISIAR